LLGLCHDSEQENDLLKKLGPKTMVEIRMRAVRPVKNGESPEKVIKTLGFSIASIYNWPARRRSGGRDILKKTKRTGRPKKLDGKRFPGFTARSWT
jgi:transposase